MRARFRTGNGLVAAVLALPLLSACGLPGSIPTLVHSACAEPSAGTRCGTAPGFAPVASIFFVGDAGYTHFEDAPVLQHLRREIVDRTSAGLAVTALYLGDNVYEDGVRGGKPHDAHLLDAQVSPVKGTPATAVFVPGNHDWANHRDSLVMMLRADSVLQMYRDSVPRPSVRLDPDPGCPGPVPIPVVAAGDTVATIVAIDSQWWITRPEWRTGCPGREETIDAVLARTVAEADGLVVVASHHPLRTGGDHGGGGGFLKKLLFRSGLSLQDVNARPYRAYVASVERALAGRPDAVVAAGHDHSLQIHRVETDAARWTNVVSGSASKVSSVGLLDGAGTTTRFAAAVPGYVRIDISGDGRAEMVVVAGCRTSYFEHVPAGDSLPGRRSGGTGANDANSCAPDGAFREVHREALPGF